MKDVTLAGGMNPLDKERGDKVGPERWQKKGVGKSAAQINGVGRLEMVDGIEQQGGRLVPLLLALILMFLAACSTSPQTRDEQEAIRLADALRDIQPPARPTSTPLCFGALSTDIYDAFNVRYAAWVSDVVQAGDLTPLHDDNRILVLEPGHGPTLVSFPRTDCRHGSHGGAGMHVMIVNSDGSYQLFDDVTGYPAHSPLPYEWIEGRFVLLATVNHAYGTREVPVEMWHLSVADGNWLLQKYDLPDTPFFSAPLDPSGELQVEMQTHKVLGRVFLPDEAPPCAFQSGTPFAAGGVGRAANLCVC